MVYHEYPRNAVSVHIHFFSIHFTIHSSYFSIRGARIRMVYHEYPRNVVSVHIHFFSIHFTISIPETQPQFTYSFSPFILPHTHHIFSIPSAPIQMVHTPPSILPHTHPYILPHTLHLTTHHTHTTETF